MLDIVQATIHFYLQSFQALPGRTELIGLGRFFQLDGRLPYSLGRNIGRRPF